MSICVFIHTCVILINRLVLPLVIRQTVNITNSGYNFTETTDLSTFGFLYGTFPAAPGVFVIATRYNSDVDLVSFHQSHLNILSNFDLILLDYRLRLLWSLAPLCQLL